MMKALHTGLPHAGVKRTIQAVMLALACCALTCAARPLLVPVLDSAWWQIAENAPDVAPYNNYPAHNACDFTIYQSTNGLWQLVACIRETSYPGGTRLFHRWEGTNLTDAMWPSARIANTFVTNGITVTVTNGIFAVSNTDPPINHVLGRMQAPHCFLHNGRYYFFYNSAGAYCKIGDDGINFTDYTNVAGSFKFFDMGRDVMIFNPTNGIWVSYFESGGVMSSRTAPAPEGPWSATAKPVRTVDNPESPFVVRYGDGYYLWQQMPVIYSTNYLDFNGPLVAHMTKQWFSGRYAPEILHHNGQYYVSGYSSGIWLARMRWEIEEVDDADLLVLETSGATLSPPFYRTTTWYTASAPYIVTNTVQTYVAADSRAAVLINGVPSVGSRSNSVDLAVGANIVAFDLTAASAARKTYTIHVTRAANPSVLSPQTSAGQISVIEGGTNTFGVRLNANPGGVVTVAVARVYGDADIKVIGGGTLVFTAANYGAYQTVSVTAEYDPDRADGVALIQCAAHGMDAVNVLVREIDQRAGTVIPVDIDFGAIPSTGMWNNLSSHAPGAVLTNVKARNGMALPTAVNINGGFTSSFTNGIAQGPFPPSAQQDGFMVPPGATASVVITGLEDAWTYDFTLFGSAFVPQDDFRTRYAAGAAEAVLNTADNTANTATLGNLAPGAGGTLVLGIARAGTATADRAALNAFSISQKPSGGTAYFDFGPTATPGYWNNVTTPEEGVKVVNAIDSAGVPTGVELAITAAFYTAISGATEGIDTNTLYPATVQVDCLRTSGAEIGAFQLRGLNPARRFDVAFYGAAWRTGTRGSDYTVNGTTVRLSATANYWNLAIVSNVAPDGSGTIHVSVRTMPGASWSYLNAMELRPSGDTVPARTFLVDCGVPALPTTGAWNNLAAHETGASLSNLVDDTGAASALALTVQDGFAEASLCGVDASDVFPSSAQRDGFTLDNADTNALIVITGLPTNTTFDITCFGSLETALPDRRTRYAIDGRPAVLDARNNAAATVRIPDVTSQLGQVTLTIASAGTNAADAGCINVLCIEAVTPEPAATALFALLALVAIKASRSW